MSGRSAIERPGPFLEQFDEAGSRGRDWRRIEFRQPQCNAYTGRPRVFAEAQSGTGRRCEPRAHVRPRAESGSPVYYMEKLIVTVTITGTGRSFSRAGVYRH